MVYPLVLAALCGASEFGVTSAIDAVRPQAFGQEAIHQVLLAMHTEPRDDLPVFPFSAQTNRLLIQSYFEPIMGPEVWEHIARFGIRP